MKDEEMAEEQIKKWDSVLYSQMYSVALVKDFIRKAFLAGLKAGRPKWHKPSEKLPADCSLVLAYDFEDSEPALFEFVTSDTWEWMPRRIACLSNDQIKCWCEIPKFKE